ncbi:MAG TPA: carbohydrate ABC transporter permease [Spirochaetia bacterium]|nr:carbohydrate ABC transporter permease [Spirochaetia bacterium]
MTRQIRLVSILRTFTMLILTVVLLFPVFWMVSTSLKPIMGIFSVPPHLIPQHFSLSGYRTILNDSRWLHYFYNSYFIACSVTLLCLVVGTLAAYGFSRMKIGAKGPLLYATLVMQMFPGVVLIVPYFELAKTLHLFNTYGVLIMADTSFVLPFTIWMLKSYLDSVPTEIESAAMIDGCSRLQAITRVVVPLMAPSFVAVGTWAFLGAWNEYMFAVTLTTGWQRAPATVGLGEFFGEFGINWNSVMATGTLSSIPLMIIFIFLQRYLVRGMTVGAVK